jgi:hypothetical protein
MVVHHFYFGRTMFRPHKADPELAIDPDAVLACPISLQCFQIVSGRYSQILKRDCSIQVFQLP